MDYGHAEEEVGRARQIHKGGASDDSFVGRTYGGVSPVDDDDLE